jgi:hypothetical protein
MSFKSSVEFGYNTELARAVHVRGSSQANSYRPQTPSYNYGPMPTPSNLSISYRTHPTTDYQYEAKSACSLPSFNPDYSEDGLDYSLSGSAYPLYGQEAVGGLSNYSSYGTSRVWIPGAPSARGSVSGIYFSSDVAAYGPSQTHFNNQAYGLRSSMSSELNNFSFSDMTSSLPVSEPATSHTRILPIPARRNNSVLAPLHRSANDLGYSGNTMNAVGGHPLAASQLMTGGHPTPLSYLPHPSNADSIDGYSCNSLTGNLSQPQPDLYSASDNWSPAPLTTDPALRSHNSSSDIYYSHCSDTTRKASQSGQTGINSTLTNGHNSSSDIHYSHSSDVPRKASQSGQSGQSSLSSTLTNSHSSSSEVYYSQCNDTSRKASQSSQSSASGTLTTSHVYQVPYSQGKSLIPRSSSMTSIDIARTASHRPSTGNLHAAS